MVDNDVIVDKIDFDRSDFDLVDLVDSVDVVDVVDLVDLVDVVDKIDFDRSGRNSRGWGCDCSCSCNKGKILTLDCWND